MAHFTTNPTSGLMPEARFVVCPVTANFAKPDDPRTVLCDSVLSPANLELVHPVSNPSEKNMHRSLAIVAMAASGLFAFTTSAIAQTTWTVCADGCQFTSINAAIDDASNGDVIQLSAEYYTEGVVIDTDGKAITLRGATDKDGKPTSILNGSGLHQVLRCAGGEGSETIFRNVVITQGKSITGAGIFLEGSSPTMINCTFMGNDAPRGGAMYSSDSSPTLTDCTFTGNHAAYGGAMYSGDSSPTLTDCTFSYNTATYRGAGMYNLQSSPDLISCRFTFNTSTSYGGGMYNSASSPTLGNCEFMSNTSQIGGGMCNDNGSNPALTDCTFVANSVRIHDGGGMYNMASSSPALSNCEFMLNHADGRGGGMFNEAGSPILTNCSFCGNTDGSGFNSISGSIDGSSSGNNLLDVGCVFGDINLDGVVNLADRTELSAIIGICDADINGDGMVDGADLSYVLGYWGICGTP